MAIVGSDLIKLILTSCMNIKNKVRPAFLLDRNIYLLAFNSVNSILDWTVNLPPSLKAK